MTIIYLWIWFAGVIIALPRFIAIFYEIDEEFILLFKPSPIYIEVLFSLFSWLAVFAGVMIYYQDNEKYFWKWSKIKLWQKHNSNQTAK